MRSNYFLTNKLESIYKKAAKMNHLSVSELLLIIGYALIRGRLTVYNGEIMTKKTIYETPNGLKVR